jgi:hypothetical protein
MKRMEAEHGDEAREVNKEGWSKSKDGCVREDLGRKGAGEAKTGLTKGSTGGCEASFRS